MEQLKDPKKMILWLLIAITIISGIITVATKGFNVELRYTAHKTIELTIGETVNAEQIQSKADEVFGKGKSIVQIVEVYKDTVQIAEETLMFLKQNISSIQKLNDDEVMLSKIKIMIKTLFEIYFAQEHEWANGWFDKVYYYYADDTANKAKQCLNKLNLYI